MRLKKDNLNSPGSMNPHEFGTGFSSPRHTSKLISTKRGKSGAPQRVIIGRASNLSFVCVVAGRSPPGRPRTKSSKKVFLGCANSHQVRARSHAT